jgi:monovalent cation:H+ antiporter-2, CPA2 family
VLFDVSLALGAFFAGVVLGESDLSQRAAADSLPLKDAFAVLFFVSVGMLFDPSILLRDPLAVLAVLGIILLGKTLVAFAIVRAFSYPVSTALTVAASLAQIGEFSFILGGLGAALGILPPAGRDLILAGAILSIALNPLAFAAIRPITAWLQRSRIGTLITAPDVPRAVGAEKPPSMLRNHAVIVGYGRVGGRIGPMLEQCAVPYVVIERDRRLVASLRQGGVSAVYGDASLEGILDAAGVRHARVIVIATPDGLQTRHVLRISRELNPQIKTAVRTHSDSERGYLERAGVDIVTMGEHHLAMAMAEFALACFGVPEDRARPSPSRP